MDNYLNVLYAATLPNWVHFSFPIIRLIILILLVILSLAMIAVVMLQPSNSEGMGALTGQTDTFYSKNKGRTLEGTLKRLTVILGIVMGALAIIFFLLLTIQSGDGGSVSTETTTEAVKALMRLSA